MMNKEILKSIFLVLLGAASYGTLATLVKLAYRDGYTVTEVLMSQYILGTLIMTLLYFIFRKTSSNIRIATTRRNKWLLILGGSTYGMTGYFYYLSLQFIPVSVAVVLLMQTVWMGVVVESIQQRKMPSGAKMIATIIVLVGTIFATNAITEMNNFNAKGVFWGLMAALTYTAALFISNNKESKLHPIPKTLMMLIGSTIFVFVIGIVSKNEAFNVSILWKWGLLLALFGAILPPVLLNKGIPKVGIGLGALLIAIEIPISLFMARYLLKEIPNFYQWSGVVLILLAIFLINFQNLRRDIKQLT